MQLSKLDANLISACNAGDLDEVNKLIEKGANPDCIEPDTGYSCIAIAIEYGYVELVRVLMAKIKNINSFASKSYTPLMLAVERDRFEIVKSIVAAGADLEIKSEYDETVLFLACRENRYDIALYLIEQGADVNVIETDLGKSLLHVCYESKLISCLLANGVDPNSYSYSGETPIVAMIYNIVTNYDNVDFKSLEILAEKTDLNFIPSSLEDYCSVLDLVDDFKESYGFKDLYPKIREVLLKFGAKPISEIISEDEFDARLDGNN